MNDENLTPPGEYVDSRFPWTDFYEAMADGLLAYRDSRRELLDKVRELEDKLEEKEEGNILKNLDDICPLSVMARFNRGGLGDPKRIKFAEDLASFLCISEPVPQKFGHVGIPTVNYSRTLFFDPKEESKGDDIETMWEVFACALALANGMEEEAKKEARKAFTRSYDKVLGVNGVKKVKGVGVTMLTIGLYWIRPWFFLPLDDCSQCYIKEELRISEDPRKEGESGEGYLKLRNKVAACFNKKTCSAHSFPELAWWPEGSGTGTCEA